MKPMLACDFDESKLKFPLIAQPKIDGVRALNTTGTLTGRSLKKFGNRYTTEFFSRSAFAGLDGELAAASETDPALCRLTTSAVAAHEGRPFLLWWVFDYVTPDTAKLPYVERFKLLEDRVLELRNDPHVGRWAGHLRVIPSVIVQTQEELDTLEDVWLLEGYEGVILRSMTAPHKQGRSTAREGGLLRVKRFVDFEGIIEEIIEGEQNNNPEQTNELGHTFRSSHQANKVANGMVGAVMVRTLDDVVNRGTVVIQKGTLVKLGAGNMPHVMREKYFREQHLLLGKVGKGKFFPVGIKDKPRFPTFVSLRDPVDL